MDISCSTSLAGAFSTTRAWYGICQKKNKCIHYYIAEKLRKLRDFVVGQFLIKQMTRTPVYVTLTEDWEDSL